MSGRVHINYHQRHSSFPGFWVEPAVCLASREAAADYQRAADNAEPDLAKWRTWRVWDCDEVNCPRTSSVQRTAP